MAAIVLAGAPFPSIRRQVTVGTTLQAFTLPRGVRSVTVGGDAALWVQFTGTDGGTVSATAAWSVAANGSLTEALHPDALHRAASVFVAAQSGTATVYVECANVTA